MASLGQLSVELNGQTHTIDVRKIDIVRAEEALAKSAGKMDGMRDLYGIAWAALRRMKIDGIPDSFEAFLDLDADIDEIDAGDGEEGKDSGQAPSTGS